MRIQVPTNHRLNFNKIQLVSKYNQIEQHKKKKQQTSKKFGYKIHCDTSCDWTWIVGWRDGCDYAITTSNTSSLVDRFVVIVFVGCVFGSNEESLLSPVCQPSGFLCKKKKQSRYLQILPTSRAKSLLTLAKYAIIACLLSPINVLAKPIYGIAAQVISKV